MNNCEPEEALCTVVFRLKNGKRDIGRFIYALACRVENMQDIEVVTLSVGDLQYPHPHDLQPEVEDDQP
ncbi:hypothetical protein NRB16_01975 [Pseudomonas sp. LJDD11]|uniref:hypothetical protein n=1 Tax=unclassified Pseudomonas TaxID=196821 RepID=UPI0020979844|nr:MULTISPECIES: hypothetical protein [unclassified Pseudomonas]MCO8165909.1 hypothetical protein [Pseudomonas sp. 21LCFQ010]MCQ9422296.1 hypothetical protein [Pseudomonas sp. LJDD11]